MLDMIHLFLDLRAPSQPHLQVVHLLINGRGSDKQHSEDLKVLNGHSQLLFTINIIEIKCRTSLSLIVYTI